eukprot:2242853-Rhodomonas_salina.3
MSAAVNPVVPDVRPTFKDKLKGTSENPLGVEDKMAMMEKQMIQLQAEINQLQAQKGLILARSDAKEPPAKETVKRRGKYAWKQQDTKVYHISLLMSECEGYKKMSLRNKKTLCEADDPPDLLLCKYCEALELSGGNFKDKTEKSSIKKALEGPTLNAAQYAWKHEGTEVYHITKFMSECSGYEKMSERNRLAMHKSDIAPPGLRLCRWCSTAREMKTMDARE